MTTQKIWIEASRLNFSERLKIQRAIVNLWWEKSNNSAVRNWMGTTHLTAEEIVDQVGVGIGRNEAVATVRRYFSAHVKKKQQWSIDRRIAEADSIMLARLHQFKEKSIIPVTSMHGRIPYSDERGVRRSRLGYPECETDLKRSVNYKGGVGYGIVICDKNHPLNIYYIRTSYDRQKKGLISKAQEVDSIIRDENLRRLIEAMSLEREVNIIWANELTEYRRQLTTRRIAS